VESERKEGRVKGKRGEREERRESERNERRECEKKRGNRRD